jgi:hypothetical protein
LDWLTNHHPQCLTKTPNALRARDTFRDFSGCAHYSLGAACQAFFQ